MLSATKQLNNKNLFLIALLFLLSGAAGLIYEIVWERLLELYFGVTMISITLIVAAYMGGLGLGSLLGGRIAHRLRRVVLTYGIVEAGIAVFGFFSPSLINWIGQKTAGSPYPIVFLLSFSLLLIPTLLMGMTLPLLTQSFVNRVETSGHIIGLLYCINTLGAGIGALFAGYILIGWVGFNGATQVAAGINLLVGLGAVVLIRSEGQGRQLEKPSKSPAEEASSLPYRIILALAFLVGFINLGFEILWFRVLAILNKSTAYGFPSILFVFLFGLAIGGWIWGRRADDSTDRVHLFWKLQLGSGVVTAASFLILWTVLHIPALESWIHDSFVNPRQPELAFVSINDEFVFSRRLMVANLLGYFLPILIMVLPPSLMMGGGLPILDRIAITSANVSGRKVGDIHLANILGSVSGTLAVSFILLPVLGTELTMKFLGLLSLSFTLIIWNRLAKTRKSSVSLPVTLVVLLFILPSRGEFYTRLYETATGIKAYVRESRDAVLALGYNTEVTSPSTLWIGGIQNSYFPTYGDYERSAFTCASASLPRNILIIGMGGSNSAYFLTQMPGVESILIVELMEELGSLLNQFVPTAQATLRDPRVQYIGDDGRRYLYAHPDAKFDMIFIDPLYSFTTGHNNLYSREALQLYQTHLSQGGVFCGWKNERQIIAATTASVFPYVDQFRDWMVAGNQPFSYDRDYLNAGLENYARNSEGVYSGDISSALSYDELFSKYIRNQDCILEKEKDTPILSDMTPHLEYYFFTKPTFRPERCNQP